MFDLKNHSQLGEPVPEGEYMLKLFQPSRADSQPKGAVVQAWRKDQLVREIEVPLDYEPRFGIDVSDMQEIEKATDKLVEELKQETT